jgi:hypothetical protein
MTTHIATQVETRAATRSWRARLVALLGPLTVAAGIAWALLQPWRITLLHPYGQGFWFLVVEPPLLVVVAGAAFQTLVARPLLRDLGES